MLDRTIRVVIELDQSLNPLGYSLYLRQDGELVVESSYMHVGAFQDWNDLGPLVRGDLARKLIDIGWWA